MTDPLRKMGRRAWLPVLLASLVSVLFAGCEKTIATGSVQGKVTLDDAPYADAAVVFISPDSGQAGTADIRPDGTFTLETPLPVGSYVVFLAPKSTAAAEAGDQPVETSIDQSVPEKYWNEATSDIKVNIVEGQNDVAVELHK